MRRRRVVALLLTALGMGGAVWWLGASGHTRPAPAPDHALRTSEGSTMEKFSLLETQRNQMRWEILADVAQVDPKREITTITGVHFTLFSATHGPVLITARQGVVQNQSKTMRVCGDVRLVVGGDFSLTTECLQWHPATQELAAETPVVVHMGNVQAEGRGFRGSFMAEHFEIRDQVHARWRVP
ncbi:MAG: LPS export ABC transporter periplasmic protein LptC [Nitrospinae bacterium]|nr:LPS export ABC transporter periplasmic protein LptC [Nitrospinota bacterium]